MDIRISDFLDMFTDKYGTLEIFDIASGETVWEGDPDDMPNKFDYEEIISLDWPSGNKFCINVELKD